jgi:hypothetical protein
VLRINKTFTFIACCACALKVVMYSYCCWRNVICCCRSSSRNLSYCSLIASSMLERRLRLPPQPACDEEPPRDRNSVKSTTPVNIEYLEKQENWYYSVIVSILLKKFHKFMSSMGLSSIECITSASMVGTPHQS